MIRQDWLMRQIEMITQVIAKIVFNKESPVYILPEDNHIEHTDTLFSRLEELLAAGKVNEAENRLFDGMDPEDMRYLEVALGFYAELNAWSDEELAQCDFTRQEIKQGIRDISGIYHVDSSILL